MAFALVGARIFDGAHLRDGEAVVVDGGRVNAVVKDKDVPAGVAVRRVEGLLAPGFVDIQVNGGGGVLLNDRPTVDGVRTIVEAHRRYGTTGLLPTLITDTPEATTAVIEAGTQAARRQVPGFLGLHLEGPHLDPRRKGAHDARLIRKMTAEDLALLNPKTRTCPVFLTRRDASLTMNIYRRLPTLPESGWAAAPKFPLDVGRSSSEFARDLSGDVAPLYEGKYFHQFDVVIGAVLLIGGAWFVWTHIKHRVKSPSN